MILDLNFQRFLLEMETSAQEKEDLRTILTNLVRGNFAWFREQGIIAADKGRFFVLNYLPGPRNQYNRLVRGMVVEKPGPGFHGDVFSLVKSFPFIRFFNQGEKDADPVDFGNSEMLEKLDGTMVGVFFPHGDPSRPEFHTRMMTSAHEPDMRKQISGFHGMGQTVEFLPIIQKYVHQAKFSELDLPFTYIFEFLHEISHVVTRYTPEQYGLYLIGGRNVQTHKELTEQELDQVASRIGVRRPRRWDSIASHEEILKMMKDVGGNTDFEGFVFRDKNTGKRVKIKDPDYVKRHHLIGSLSPTNLVPLIFNGETEEILAYFPHAKEKIHEVLAAYEKYKNYVVSKIMDWHAKGLDQRTLVNQVYGQNPLQKWELRLKKMRGEPTPQLDKGEKDRFVAELIVRLANRTPDEIQAGVERTLKELAVGQGKNLGNPKEFIEKIGLKDDDSGSSDVGEL